MLFDGAGLQRAVESDTERKIYTNVRAYIFPGSDVSSTRCWCSHSEQRPSVSIKIPVSVILRSYEVVILSPLVNSELAY